MTRTFFTHPAPFDVSTLTKPSCSRPMKISSSFLARVPTAVAASEGCARILPFGPWVDALGSGQTCADGAWLERTLPVAVRRELGRLLPELGPQDGDSAAPPDYLKLFEGVGLLLAHVAQRQPTVLILEDLHWADEMSLRLLAFVGHRLQPWKLLVLATARAEDLVDAPPLQRTLAELEREPHVVAIALGPLSRADTAGLVQALSRSGTSEAVVAELSERVWRTSEGNPFVAIEAVRAAARDALASGLEALPMPERVRDIIGRRLDQLGPRHRELVAVASVVGREFEIPLLQRASGLGEEEAAEAVEELIRRRLLQSVGERLDFIHDRVREVAYGRILPLRRAMLHRRVAEALASLHEGDLEPYDLALGLHYTDGELWNQAVVHLRRAGERAAERSAIREAAACFERALAALAHLPDGRHTREQAFGIRVELRSQLLALGEFRRVLDLSRQARTFAEQLGDERRLGRAFDLLTSDHVRLGETDEALVSGHRALAIAHALPDVSRRMTVANSLGQAHYLRGEYERAVELTTGNLAVSSADVGPRGETHPRHAAFRRVSSLGWLLMSLAQLGRFAEAAPYEADVLRTAEETSWAVNVLLAHGAAGTLRLDKGDLAEARLRIEHSVAVARGANLVLYLLWMVPASALVLALLEARDEALDWLGEGHRLLEDHARAGNVGLFTSRAALALGQTALILGRFDEAQHLARRTADVSASQPGFAAHALDLLGEIATSPGRFDAESGETHYRQALALAEPRGMRPLVAHCHLGLGRLYRRTGKRQQSGEHLSAATAMYREMDMRFWLEKAESEIMALETSRKR